MAATFSTDTGTPFLFLNLAAPIPDYVIAVLPAAGASLADGATLAEIWSDPGHVFVFARISQAAFIAAEGGTGEVAQKLRNLLADSFFSETRFIWIDDPSLEETDWTFQTLHCGAPDPGTQEAQISEFTLFDWRNYSLGFTTACKVQVGRDGEQIEFLQTDKDMGEVFLQTRFGDRRLEKISQRVRLPFVGAQAGAFRFTLSFDRLVETEGEKEVISYPDLPLLDMGLRIFFRDPELINESDFGTDFRHYPIINESYAFRPRENYDPQAHYPERISLYPCLDPLQPQAEDRTFISFLPPDQRKIPEILPSNYRTNLGYHIHLFPGADTRLILQDSPTGMEVADFDPYYWVPKGGFTLMVPRYRASDEAADPGDGNPLGADFLEDNLICGIFGSEYIKLLATETLTDASTGSDRTVEVINHLTFFPGQKAFAQGFRLDQPASDEVETPFTDLATTAWAYITQFFADPVLQAEVSRGPVYYAQPDDSTFYAHVEESNQEGDEDNTDEFLNYMEVPTLGLPDPAKWGAAASGLSADHWLFPLMPYGGIDPQQIEEYRQIELQLISPERKKQITAISESVGHQVSIDTVANDASPKRGATPMGLLGTFSQDYQHLEELILAKYPEPQPEGTLVDKVAAFRDIPHGHPLRSALQSNQLFLVISDPSQLAAFFPDNRLTIEGWTFDLDPAGTVGPRDKPAWRHFGTILIFKFYDKPLIDLASDTATWTEGAIFNAAGGMNATRVHLRDLLQEAIDKSVGADPKERLRYEQLAFAAQEPAWSGILALHVNLPGTDSFPEPMRGLAGGIDEEKFYATYVGIETTPVIPRIGTDGALEVGYSSLFALIDYNNDVPPPPNGSGYNFHVRLLSVLFRNSLMIDFAAEVDLTMDQLFDEPTVLLDREDGQNVVTMKGTAERHNGELTYSFGFSGINRFDMPDSEVLPQAEILKAQFSTDPGLTNGQVQSRFSLWGKLEFGYLGEFDIFSYGPYVKTNEASDKFLSFSKLEILMRFPEDEPSETSFVFSPENMDLDSARSKAREQSLMVKFPLKMTGLTYSKAGKTVADFGFMPVKCSLNTGEPGNIWYGMHFDLNLGSLGALAGKAGFVVRVLAAWSPSTADSGKKVFIGLKMPGSTGGKKEITLQGLLKIAFKHIEFVNYRVDDSATLIDEGLTDAEKESQLAQLKIGYLLTLKNIVLKFLLLSIPPNARTEIILFGDPREGEEEKLIGWYASYVKT